MTQTYTYYLAGRAESPNSDLEVIDKFSGEVAARVALAEDRLEEETLCSGTRRVTRQSTKAKAQALASLGSALRMRCFASSPRNRVCP